MVFNTQENAYVSCVTLKIQINNFLMTAIKFKQFFKIDFIALGIL